MKMKKTPRKHISEQEAERKALAGLAENVQAKDAYVARAGKEQPKARHPKTLEKK